MNKARAAKAQIFAVAAKASIDIDKAAVGLRVGGMGQQRGSGCDWPLLQSSEPSQTTCSPKLVCRRQQLLRITRGSSELTCMVHACGCRPLQTARSGKRLASTGWPLSFFPSGPSHHVLAFLSRCAFPAFLWASRALPPGSLPSAHFSTLPVHVHPGSILRTPCMHELGMTGPGSVYPAFMAVASAGS